MRVRSDLLDLSPEYAENGVKGRQVERGVAAYVAAFDWRPLKKLCRMQRILDSVAFEIANSPEMGIRVLRGGGDRLTNPEIKPQMNCNDCTTPVWRRGTA